MKNQPLISVVVATKNEEKNIERCLMSIQKQTSPQKDIEIIVVDAGSQDKTRPIAKNFTSHVFNLLDDANLKDVQNIRGAQINFGVKKSKGSIIFFPDTDMTFNAELLDEAINLMREDYIDALYIPEVVLGKGFFGKIRNFERSFYNMTPIDAVRIVKKDLFQQIDGFDTKNIMFGPDDWDFTKRIKQQTNKIGITKNQLYHHEKDLSLKKYLTKKQKYSHTFSGYIKKWGRNDPDVKKQLGTGYRFAGVFIEKGKWKKLLTRPVLTIGMFTIRFAVGIPYLYQRLFRK